MTANTAHSPIDKVTMNVDSASARWGPATLRWIAAMLWLSNVVWKIPPTFGRSGPDCGGLCYYTRAGVDHPVLPGAPWLFEHIISPHLWAFGWITIVSEVALAALLMSGRFQRSAAVLGIVQSFAIMAAVANTPGEWFWAYILMIGLHLGVLVTASTARPQSARAMAGATIGFGVIIAIAHSGEGLTGRAFTLFVDPPNTFRPLPNEFGRNVFTGSVALGLIVAAIGIGGIIASKVLDAAQQRIAGMALVVVAVVLMFTYDEGGLLIGLGSSTTMVAVLAALGLGLAVAPVAGALTSAPSDANSVASP